MSSKAKAFPYPYKSPYSNDYLDNVVFELHLTNEVRVTDDNLLCIPYSIELAGKYFVDCLLDKSVSLVIDVRSPKTFFSKILPVEEFVGEIQLDGNQLMGAVSLIARLVSTRDRTDYSPGQLNPEFGISARFEISEGDLLGETSLYTVPVDFGGAPTDFTPKLVPRPDWQPHRYEVVTDKPRLEIHAGLSACQVVNSLLADSSVRPYLWMSVYKDLIVKALQELKENGPEAKWAQALDYQLEQMGLALENYPSVRIEELAQLLVSEEGILEVARVLE